MRKTNEWFKTERCSADQPQCVEVIHTDTNQVMVRHSATPGAIPLTFSPDEWSQFIAGVKDGEFDL